MAVVILLIIAVVTIIILLLKKSTPSGSLTEQLKDLKQLRKSGAITEEEYEKRKAIITYSADR